MLTFPRILARTSLIVAVALLSDGCLSYGLSLFGLSFSEVMGDLMLVEVALLFLLAGIIEFSSSVGAMEIRRVLFGSRTEYSDSSHKEAGRRALVLVLAGAFIFAILIVIGVLSGS
jgi:hypothetical protein